MSDRDSIHNRIARIEGVLLHMVVCEKRKHDPEGGVIMFGPRYRPPQEYVDFCAGLLRTSGPREESDG